MRPETAKAAAAEIYRQMGSLGLQCKLVTDKEMMSDVNVYACLRTAAGGELSLRRPLQGNIVTVRDQLAFAKRAEQAVQEWLDNDQESIFKLIDFFLLLHSPLTVKPELTPDNLQDLLERFIPDSFSLDCFQDLPLKLEVKLGQVYHSATDDEWELKKYLPAAAIEVIFKVAETAEIAQDPAQGTWRSRPPLFR